MIVHDTQHFMAERMHAWAHSYPVDHASMVTAPGLVVEIICAANGETMAADRGPFIITWNTFIETRTNQWSLLRRWANG